MLKNEFANNGKQLLSD